jgi:class 3 adenylate cyclase
LRTVIIPIRESFAAKLLASLVGTVGVLLIVTFLVVQAETQRQVEVVSARAVRSAEVQFQGLEEFQRREVDRAAELLAGGVRTRILLDVAIAEGDRTYLGGHVSYELLLAGIPDIVVAFTDPEGAPVLTLHNDVPMEEADPLEIGGVAGALMGGDAFEVRSYRVLEGTLFAIRTRVIEEGGRAIGTMSLGLPLSTEDITQVGSVVGVEVCIVIAGDCVAGTPRGEDALSAALTSLAGSTEVVTADADGELWSVRARPLLGEAPDEGWRVVAVPLTPVLTPFDRIRQALFLGGGAALLLALLVGVALSRGLSRPIRDLVAATHRVAEGDFETEVAVASHDEVGTLAEAFNEMTRGLLLKERYRSVLNKVVSKDVAKELMDGEVELGGENRRVTVLFADIRGFTPLTDGMEPQEVIGFLNECMQRLSDAVEAEGGVVDKYVGDELMAVFGVPVSHGDDALRAVRAAVRMKKAMTQWNLTRTDRGLLPVDLGVGINSGVAVAGNMGSRNRLNYTVLGDMVNMGARLCSGAGAGEILVTQATLDEAGDGVRFESKGEQAFKGFASEVEVFGVLDAHGISEELTEGEASAVGGGPQAPRLASLVLAGALALSAALPGAGAAQDEGLPTLADAGLGYVSPSGFFQVSLSGNLDIEGFRFADHKAGLAWVDAPGTYLVAHRLRLFTDVFVGERVYGLLELRSDRGPTPNDGELEARIEQAYLRLSNLSGSLSLQAGRFASPFGSYPGRHLTPVDPFIRPPLPYDIQTIQSSTIAPHTASGFLDWKWDPARFRHAGTPPIWEVPYQWGAMVAGATGRFSYRVAAMNSAPSSAPEAWALDLDRFDSPSWVAGVGFAVSPELSLGASYNRGPWLEEITGGDTSVNANRADFVQELFAGDVTYAKGRVMLRGEIIHDRWEVPNVADDPVEIGYSLEAQTDITAGLFAAVRYGGLNFSFVDDGLGAASSRTDGGTTWDHDVRRYEVALGYRVVRNAGVILSWFGQGQIQADDSDTNLTAVRLWWAF